MNGTEHLRSPRGRPDAAVARLAEAQHGVVTRGQALLVGMSAEMVRHRVDTGRWRRVLPGVYVIGGVPRSGRQECLAACLWAGHGAVVSHRSAGVLWGLDGVSADRIDITVPKIVDHRSNRLTVHRTCFWCDDDLDELGGVPVTSATRTLIDLAGVLRRDALELALEDAFRRELSTPRAVEDAVERPARGRRGLAQLRVLLAERRPGPRSESGWEVRVARLLVRHGLPVPARQHEVVHDGHRFRLDLAYVDEHVGIEFDSLRWHSGRARIEHDSHRRNALRAAGWHLVHVTAVMVRERPELVVRVVRDALRRPLGQER